MSLTKTTAKEGDFLNDYQISCRLQSTPGEGEKDSLGFNFISFYDNDETFKHF
jgi:hypothetical protein